jgi:subtilisin-like proprotein convertase family protein
MKNLVSFVLLVLLIFFSKTASLQVIYNSKIDSVINLISIQSIARMNKELSGDTIVTIGGVSQILYSRYWPTTGNIKASQYIYEKFQSFGLNPNYMISSTTNYNVYAVKTGTKYPNKKYIIGAHYDDIIYPLPGLNETIYGADDNASGVCAVLEASRLLANMNLDYTVIFVAFDEEEGLGNGGEAFADSIKYRGDTVLGVLNLDMIAYDNNNDYKADVWANNYSVVLQDVLVACNQVYQIGLILKEKLNGYGSDQISFWMRGYKALAFAEDEDNFNPYYHTKNDRYNKLNIQYFHKMVKASVAALLTWALGSCIEINHVPLASTTDTSARIALVQIKSPVKISTGANTPRLYYKVGNESYSFVNSFSIVQDTFKFLIPGSPIGSIVSYYIAVQDSAGNITVTLPRGGSGINPPGTVPPANPFVYYTLVNQFYVCSNTVPKPINGLQVTNDTIIITQTGLITDVKVNLNINHTNDGDLYSLLYSPSQQVYLYYRVGQGGQNFTNTIFDDTASLSITQGTPPFTGRFRPQYGNLNYFNNLQMAGKWVLFIYDLNTGNQGTLLSWCLSIKYVTSVGVKEKNQVVKNYKLYQNYPNPFNGRTVIGYSLLKNSNVTLKIYDVLGREVNTLVNENLKTGQYEVSFDGNDFPSGIYFYKITAGDFTDTKRMILIK